MPCAKTEHVFFVLDVSHDDGVEPFRRNFRQSSQQRRLRGFSVAHEPAGEEACEVEGDLPVNGGDPGGKRRHFIVAVVFSRYDEGRQFDVGFGGGCLYELFYRLQVAAEFPVVFVCEALEVDVIGVDVGQQFRDCLLYTSPSPRD